MNSKILFLSLISFVTVNLNGMDTKPTNQSDPFADQNNFLSVICPDIQNIIKEFINQINPSDVQKFCRNKYSNQRPEVYSLMAQMIFTNEKLRDHFKLKSELEETRLLANTDRNLLLEEETYRNWSLTRSKVPKLLGIQTLDYTYVRNFVQELYVIACWRKYNTDKFQVTYTPPPAVAGAGIYVDPEQEVNTWIQLLRPLAKKTKKPVDSTSLPAISKQEVIKPDFNCIWDRVEFTFNSGACVTWHQNDRTKEFHRLLDFVAKNYSSLITGLNEKIQQENPTLVLQKFRSFLFRNEELFKKYLNNSCLMRGHQRALQASANISDPNCLPICRDIAKDQIYGAVSSIMDDERIKVTPTIQTTYHNNLIALHDSLEKYRNNNNRFARFFSIIGECIFRRKNERTECAQKCLDLQTAYRLLPLIPHISKGQQYKAAAMFGLKFALIPPATGVLGLYAFIRHRSFLSGLVFPALLFTKFWLQYKDPLLELLSDQISFLDKSTEIQPRWMLQSIALKYKLSFSPTLCLTPEAIRSKKIDDKGNTIGTLFDERRRRMTAENYINLLNLYYEVNQKSPNIIQAAQKFNHSNQELENKFPSTNTSNIPYKFQLTRALLNKLKSSPDSVTIEDLDNIQVPIETYETEGLKKACSAKGNQSEKLQSTKRVMTRIPLSHLASLPQPSNDDIV